MNDFLHITLPGLNRSVHRLGLSGAFHLEEAAAAEAMERGLQYIFWSPRYRGLTAALKPRLKQDRERYVLATGPLLGFFGGSVRRAVESALRTLGTEYLDVGQLFWLGRMSAWSRGTVEELHKLKAEGKLRALGVSIHDRQRAGRLAQSGELDLLMIRYNAAHPGAETDIFPHLQPQGPAIVAYTATSWRKLLRAPRGWQGRVPTAGDCYRFCLTNPSVHVVLCGPKNVAQLEENLRALEEGPLSAEELSFMRDFGKAVHG